jgi:hypothetical protein
MRTLSSLTLLAAISSLAANPLAADRQVVTVTGQVAYVNYRRGSKARGEETVALTVVEPETRREISVRAKAAQVPNVRIGDTITVTGRFTAARLIGELKLD